LEHLQPDTSELHNIVMAVNLCKLMSSISRHAVDMNPFNRKKRRYPGFFLLPRVSNNRKINKQNWHTGVLLRSLKS